MDSPVPQPGGHPHGLDSGPGTGHIDGVTLYGRCSGTRLFVPRGSGRTPVPGGNDRDREGSSQMSTVKEAVDVEVPVHTAYNQWTQFEEFPHFMEGVEEVRQLDERHNHWTTQVSGVKREFDTEIVDQLPDERITWRTTTGDTNQKGTVRFQRLDDTHTRVELVMDVDPTGVAEKTGDMLGVIDRRVKGDMQRFKEYIEKRGGESGAWRGRIRPGE